MVNKIARILFLLLILLPISLLTGTCLYKEALTEKPYIYPYKADEVALNHFYELKAKKENLSAKIKDLEKTNSDLSQVLKQLKKQKAKIQYVVETKTEFVPVERNATYEKPTSCDFKYGENIVAGKFIVEGNSYSCVTYDLHFDTDAVIMEDTMVYATKITSSYDPSIVEIVPSTIHITNVKKPFKVLSPKLVLGVGALMPTGEVLPTLGLSTIHISENVDLFNVIGGTNLKTYSVGLEIGSLNIGRPLPLVDDLWIGFGPAYTSNREWDALVNLSTRL